MARDPDYLRYWELEYWSDRPVKRAYWDDPLPAVQGMLTSEYIVLYDQLVGGMILPEVRQDLLKTASYELTLGWRCMVEGKDIRLTEKDPWLAIPPNSIAFVSMQQVLRLPHYLVGRFDLAIDFIYEGLLLGTGPQVDPGFQGALGCPLHNISNDSIYLKLGQPFAKIDFVKTAPPLRAARAVAWRDDADQPADLARALNAKNPEPYLRNVKLFKRGEPEWREPVYDYLRGKRPRSSVAPLKDVVERLRRYGVIGVVSLTLTALTFVVLYVQARTDRLASEGDLVELRENNERELQDLRRRVAELD